MYLWCSRCWYAHLRERWMTPHHKYGSCPSCGVSEYRNAVAWEKIAAANGYPHEPDKHVKYEPEPTLF